MKSNRIRFLLLLATCWVCVLCRRLACAASNVPPGMVAITGGVFRPLFSRQQI